MARRPPLAWTELHLVAGLSAEAARDAIQALAGLSKQPRIVLEARGAAGRVSWHLGTDRDAHARVLAALRPHLPDLRVMDKAASLGSTPIAASLQLAGHRRLPLRVAATESVTRSLLAALAEAKPSESIRLQLILGPRRRPQALPATSPQPRRELRAKLDEHHFGATLRIAAHSSTDARTRRLIGGVGAALRGLELPGVRVHLRRTSADAVRRVRSPLLWSLDLAVSEVVPLLAWPIAKDAALALPGVAAVHPRLLSVAEPVPSRGRVLGVATTDKQRHVALSVSDSLRHLHILGPTGVGKSELMAHLALQDIEQGRGVVVIDPKRDLVQALLARMPEQRLDDVVLLDPTDAAPVGIQPLAGADPDLAADTVLSVFHSLYADSWGPRTHDILHASLLSLARRGDASLVMVPMLLTNAGFRRSVVGSIVKRDPMGLGSFWGWFEAVSDAERSQAIAPLMNKLRPLLLRPGLRAVFGQRQPRFSLPDVFTQRRILLVSLSKGTLGPDAARLLGSLVIALLWQAALARTSVPAAQRPPVMVHVDEVQDYLRLPGDLGDALAQARGLGVGFTLAHQHLAQLPVSLREAVLANARSRVAFQLGAADARLLAGTTHGRLAPADFTALPAYEAYASLLAGGTKQPWLSLSTRPLPHATRATAEVEARSRANYGQPLDTIEADLLTLLDDRPGTGEAFGRVPRDVGTPPGGGAP